MADKISFDLVSPEQLLLATEADMVTIPGSEGDMGVMAGHAPVVTTLRPGTVRIAGGSGSSEFFVSGGFAEINAAKLTLLAEDAVILADLDGAVLDGRIAAVTEAIQTAKSEADRAKSQQLLDALSALKTHH